MSRPAHPTDRPSKFRSQRRGIAVFKILLLIPVLLILLVFVLEIGNVWIARLEFENALESAALAAVKEWGDDIYNADTATPRQVGNTFAQSNTVRWSPVDLSSLDSTLNLDPTDPTGNPNQNANCSTGVMIFGAITAMDPAVVFEAGTAPSCGGSGNVFIDATAQGSLGADNAWGVSFRTDSDPTVNASRRVEKIVIDLDPNNASGGLNSFNFSSQPPTLSSNSPETISASNGSQPDNFGFTQAPNAPTNQVLFNYDTSTDYPTVLEITFTGDFGLETTPGEFIPGDVPFLSTTTKVDYGFSPGDRFRFGADILVGGQQGAGHELGDIGAQVTIYFSTNGVADPTPVTGTFFNNQTAGLDRSQDCNDPAIVIEDDRGFDHYVVHGREILDLPCPPTSAASNNGQSFLVLTGAGAGGQHYAVKAQGELQVPMVITQLFGCNLGPFKVQAEAVAYYDCDQRQPCLIRVDQLICN